MSDNRLESRFEAADVRRLAATKGTGRIELRFSDTDEKQLCVTLPLDIAIDFARLVVDLAEGTPFLKGKRSAEERETKA